jgi:hypothetical protein
METLAVQRSVLIDRPRQDVWRAITDPAHPGITLLNSFRLNEENGSARLTVLQSGYEALPDGTREEQLSMDEGAYAAVVESLRNYRER